MPVTQWDLSYPQNGVSRRWYRILQGSRKCWCPQRECQPFNPISGKHHRAVFGNNQVGGLSMGTGLFVPWETEYGQHVG